MPSVEATMASHIINPRGADYPPGFSPLHRIAALETLLVIVTDQLAALRTSVFANIHTAEETGAAPPKGDVSDLLTATFVQYNLAQADCGRVWSPATLNTDSGQLQIEGHTPRVAILDTGAGSIILGKSFAANLPLCHPALLIPAGSFMTASGAEETNVQKTKHALTFVLAKGTPARQPSERSV